MKKAQLVLLGTLIPVGLAMIGVVQRPAQQPPDLSPGQGPIAEKSPLAEAARVAQADLPALASDAGRKVPHLHGGDCISCAAGKPHTEPVRLSKVLQASYFEGMKEKGGSFGLALPDGKEGVAVVERVELDAAGNWVMSEGRMTAPAEGRFLFRRQPEGTPSGRYAGAIRFPAESYGYLFEQAEDGSPQLTYAHADGVSCVNYAKPQAIPLAENAPEAEYLLPDEHPTDAQIPAYQNGVIPLQSLPRATGVVYLDFDGEEGPFEGWGNFDAAPSGSNNAQIFEVWSRVAEDFAPFNINVTTDLQIYLDAPETSRQRCIITPTTNAAPGAGGVAYIGSWNWDGDTPCWAFYTTGKNSAEVISHEVGHTLGLGHDGRVAEGTSDAEGYYGGHSGWAPIMGVGYYQNLSQWSKGEYARADQKQDDLAVMDSFNAVDFRADDSGDSPATASPLELFGTTINDDGIIGTRSDVDVYKFTTTGGSAAIAIKPLNQGPNLDISAELRNAGGSVIATSNPDPGIDASFNLNLAAGTYTLHIDGTGRGDVLADGYSDYGSLGHYVIDGNIAGAISPDRFSVNEFAPVGTAVGTVTPDKNHGANPLAFSIVPGNSGSSFAINPVTGAITVANPTRLDFSLLSSGWDDPAVMELLVQVTDAAQPALNETIRVVVTVIDTGATSPAILKHRYSFTTGTNDSIGTAHLSLAGSATVSGGKLDLPGGLTRTNHATAQGAGLAELAATIHGSTAVTMEAWFNQDTFQNFAKLFMAGTASGADYLDITPRRGSDGNVSSISIRKNSGGESNVKGGSAMWPNVEYYVAAIWDEVTDCITLKVGPVGGSLTTVSEPMNGRKLEDLEISQFFLGSAVFWPDPDFDGQLDEFRIWRGVPSDSRIAKSFAAGPNPSGDSDLDGLPDSWELSFTGINNLTMLDGNRYAKSGSGAGSGDYDGDGLSDYDEYNGGSGSTNPTKTDSDNDGFSDLLERAEGTNPNDPNSGPSAKLAHRYGFNAGAIDIVGTADLTLKGGASVANGSLDVPGGPPRDSQAYAEGPALAEVAATIQNAYAVSIEAWFKQDVAQNWAKVVMAGKGSDGNYIDLTPRRGVNNNVSSASFNTGAGESTAIGGPNGTALVNGTKYYAAAIWNPLTDLLTLRMGPVGGTLSTFTTPMGGKKLSQLLVNEFRIGAAVQFDDPNFDGQIDEVRVWKGVLSNAQIATNFAAGPVQPAGDADGDGLPDEWEMSFPGIHTLHVLGPAKDFDGDGLLDTAEPLAGTSPLDNDTDHDGFSDLAEVNAGTNPTDPNSAPAVPPALLTHRYSFSGNLADSVGTANLSLVGTASVTGGKLNLPGGATRTNHARAQGASLAELASTIDGASALTIEGWFTQDTAQDWSKLLMLGLSTGGNYIDITPKRGIDGNVPSASINPGNGEARVLGGTPLPNATPHYFAATWDVPNNRLVLRIGPVGGTLKTFLSTMGGKNLGGLNIDQFFLGAAVAFGDPDFDGQIDELRIWKGSLTRTQVLDHFAVGPEEVGTQPTFRGSAVNVGATGITLNYGKLVAGQVYHVESSPTLSNFTPVPGSEFTAGSESGSVSLPINKGVDPKLFFRLMKGPIP
ncbi:LamG-like jellyroll fold domain-containing protein [Luteolibacter luteus]|uniref:Cadherin domain-containing protein n=1 Tax=Luteolibacter luteus TaxID=2728835 RepID=A0A858RDK6_9BACT|nr:LamG-like jellyroll fold domain-containing protein [Luteolibacter luteus]QJE94263.1 hypothetical protein HHL09_00170 [Luteolibacter luteus]